MVDFWANLGFALLDLNLVTALVAMVALALGQMRPLAERPQWERLGIGAFGIHAVGVVGVLALLWGLILSKNYAFHYVWSHSSNELPVYFSIACLWEGQEGSFLIWMFWHAVLGVLAWRWVPRDWRGPVLAVVASVQLILATMVLGIYIPAMAVKIVLSLALIALALWYARLVLRSAWSLRQASAAAVGLMAVLAVYMLWAGHVGWAGQLSSPGYLALLAAFFAAIGFVKFGWLRAGLGLRVVAPALAVGGLAMATGWLTTAGWRVGSSPFVLMRDHFAGAPIFASNPDFVPTNGNGLNALLQNYWMVIHPPTLFLGFASTLIPFAFAIAGLWKRDFGGWVRPATGWSLFSAAILGTGIMMGGYWAYETLNFEGYWNWDPVENASLVPWLTGVASLHTLLAWRKGKRYLTYSYVLVLSTFILILYSTFLTRSGVLGDASVHSFTDLGLSGQLLLLLFVYLMGMGTLLADRWNAIPRPAPTAQAKPWTRELFLFLSAAVLTLMAAQISFVTSIPVLNQIFGTQMAPPAELQFFYYRWNVWFGIAIAALSAVGQYFFWTRIESKALMAAIFRPFVAAIVASLAILVWVSLGDTQFVYHKALADALREVQGQGFGTQASAYFRNGLLMLADDLLLVAALFTVLANLDIIWRISRRKRINLRHAGGSLAHIGLGLLLIGALFSSGYQTTVTINSNPSSLGDDFPAAERIDNVMLFRGQSQFVEGWRVTYKGKLQAQAPIRDLRVLEQNAAGAKIAFRDAAGHRFAQFYPASFFTDEMLLPDPTSDARRRTPVQLAQHTSGLAGHGQSSPDNFANRSIDLAQVQQIIEANLNLLKPPMVNGRSLFEVEFVALKDSNRRFTVFPEAEVSGKGESQSLISHPDRRVGLRGDIYVHVTSIPAEPKPEDRRTNIYEKRLFIGDTLQLARSRVRLDSVVPERNPPPELENLVYLVLRMTTPDGRDFFSKPAFTIQDNQMGFVSDIVPELETLVQLTAVTPDNERGTYGFTLRFQESAAPPDYITLKAVTKPGIGLVWLGTLVIMLGFGVAFARRMREGKGTSGPDTADAAPIRQQDDGLVVEMEEVGTTVEPDAPATPSQADASAGNA